MSFLDRYQQLSDDLAQFDLFKDFLVADYHIFKSLIFAKITLNIQNDFAKCKKKRKSYEQKKSQGIIWTKSIAAI
jgi:hypothetical protein